MRDYISFSQINQYCRCGIAYFLKYEDGIVLPDSTSLILGKQYHASLEINHRQKVKTIKDLPLPELKDFYASKVEDEFKKDVLLDKEETEKGKVAVRDNAITRGHAGLQVYHEVLAPFLLPMEVEKNFTVQMDDDLPPLKGIIDLVNIDMSVIDHKTAAKAPPEGEADGSIQLSAYALGFYALYGYLPDELQLQYAIVSEKGNAKHKVLKTKRTPEQLTRFVERVRRVVDGIRKGVAIPPEQSSWACSYCGYKNTGHCKVC